MSVLVIRNRVRHHAAFWWDVFLAMQEDKNPQRHRVLQDELSKLHQEHEKLSYTCRLYENEPKFLESFSLLARRKWHLREYGDSYSLRLGNVYICSTPPVLRRSSTNHRSVTLSSCFAAWTTSASGSGCPLFAVPGISSPIWHPLMPWATRSW